MEQETRTLKVGDRIYRSSRSEVEDLIIIERVTKTQALSGNYKFKLEVSAFGVRLIAAGRWDTNRYELETPELKERYLRATVARKAKRIDYTTLPIEIIKQIDVLLTPPTTT